MEEHDGVAVAGPRSSFPYRAPVPAHADVALATVADRIGYESTAAFTRAFTREFGVPPGRYRRFDARGPSRARDERHEPE